ncbi:MAG: hypothetical protein ACFFDN_47115 [Candidatus Hodarchaeota archaeon]
MSDIDRKDVAIGLLVIGLVALAGWVGFLYASPVTKTKTEEEEETIYITTKTKTIEEIGLPDDWGLAELDASFSVFNETGGEISVKMSDILNGISLYYNQEADPLGRKTQEYKYEYMELRTVDDPLSGRTFTGVNILDVLEFAGVFFAWNISCKTNNVDLYPNAYFNVSTGDIINLDTKPLYLPTIVAIAADGLWLPDLGYGNFSIIQGLSSESIYDLKEIRTMSEWEVDIIVDGIVEYQVNRTNIIDPHYPDGWHWEYHKNFTGSYNAYMGGRMTYNRTFWGVNMSYIINQTNAENKNYTMRAVSVDGWLSNIYNNTDINFGLVYPENYGYVNYTDNPPTGVPLPETDLLITLVYMEQKFFEYGLFASDPIWDKGYYDGYNGGAFHIVIPGMTKDQHPGYVKSIEITTYAGPIP